jgi:FAD-dependent oxidoreductase domain-containing protein 1
MYDVVMIGGGLHGGFAAWHLLKREPGLRIAIVEKDPTYEFAASARSNAGIRVLFSQEENLRMSQYGHEVYGNFGELMAVDGTPQPLSFWRHGYLFIANTAAQADDMAANYEVQTALGAEADLIDAAELKRRRPSMNTDDVTLACHSPKDGWIDPYGALMGLKRKNQALGVTYLKAAATGFTVTGGAVRTVTLDTGETLAADWFLNTTGAWAREITGMLGFDIPVAPLPRITFYFECREQLEQHSLTIDGKGCSFKPEGKGYVTGHTVFSRAGAFDWTVHEDRFEAENWPLVSHRIPAFETVKLVNSWACHYALSEWDGNALLGAWPGQPENFLMATGFSGHGLQQAPASGRALSELILDGGFQALDLNRFAASRVLEGRKEPERGVKA